MKIHTETEIRAIINDLWLKPAKATSLSIDQKEDVLHFIYLEKRKAIREACEIVDANPNYKYPEGVTNEVDYWVQKVIGHFLAIEQLLNKKENIILEEKFINGLLQYKIGNNYPVHLFALTELIIRASGSSNYNSNLDMSSAERVEKYGFDRFGIKNGFYQSFTNIDINNLLAHINSNPKHKRTWKKSVIEISGNDADVISYLKHLPNGY